MSGKQEKSNLIAGEVTSLPVSLGCPITAKDHTNKKDNGDIYSGMTSIY